MRRLTAPPYLILLLSAILGLVAEGAPLPSNTYFKRTGIVQGLPDNSVNAIAEDSLGFLWVGTWNGLARYDGRTSKIFRNSPDDPTSLTNDMVRALAGDSAGVWVGSDNGLDYYSIADGHFRHCHISGDHGKPSYRMTDRVSRVLIADGGVFAVSINGNILRLERHDRDSDGRPVPVFRILPRPAGRRYADICRFTRGRLLAYSNEGITVLSADGEREIIHTPTYTQFDTNLNIYFDPEKRRVITGAGIGGICRAYRVTDSDGSLEEDHDLPIPDAIMSTVKIDSITYFATDGGGLFAQMPDGKLTHFIPANSSISGDAIYTAYADRDNNLWLGTYRSGMCLLSPEQNRYTVCSRASGAVTYDIITAVQPHAGRLYLGLDGGGLDVVDTESGLIENFNTANSDIPGNNVVSIVKDGQMLWLGVYSRGLSGFNTVTKTFTNYTVTDEPGNKVWVLADDRRGSIWVGCNGLHVFDKAQRTFTAVAGAENVSVMSIADGGDFMWIGTRYQGILKVNKRSRRITARYSDSPSNTGLKLPERSINYTFLDSRGYLWATLGRHGLISISPGGHGYTEVLKSYQVDRTLPDVHVQSIVEDRSGTLWMATTNGLYKFDRRSETFTRIRDSRLPTVFTSNASAYTRGHICFGSTSGLLIFDPAYVPPPRRHLPLIFTGLTILGHEPRELPLPGKDDSEVCLAHDENFFTVNFTVPEMTNPDGLGFECMLEGFDTGWRDASESRSATYTNVPPGKYRLMVRHFRPDGYLSATAMLPIDIAQPWYGTVWANILWLLLAAAVIATGLRTWHRLMMASERVRLADMEKANERNLANAKLDFYANISHELRTPCFLIAAQVEEILDSPRQTVPTAHLHGIYRNALKLNKLISHIIDFRKIESGHLRLVSRKLELTAFVGDLTPDYENLCKQKNISFSYVHDTPPVEALLDPDKLELIISNLVSNAYKYTPDGGEIILSVRDLGETVDISVKDTGIGIVEKMRGLIFEPYFRTERGREQSSGDGIGLAFVKELVELHGGHIDLDSQVNSGSTFSVILPKEPAGGSTVRADGHEHEADGQTWLPSDAADSPGAMVTGITNPTAIHSILFVDDDPEVSSLLARSFGQDFRVCCASDGQEGVEMALSGDFDVVVTDIMMPRLDGHGLIKAIKAEKKLRHVKVVVFSAVNAEDDMLRAYNEGVDAFYTKPMSLKLLRVNIDRLLGGTGADETPKGLFEKVTEQSAAYNKEEQKFLLEVRAIIDENLRNEEFGIDFLAARLAMSHSSLYKKIRKMTGMTLVDFINEYRICKAVALFRQGNTNVATVAELCGFRDIKTFRETFKRKMHMPPKQYLQSINGESKE